MAYGLIADASTVARHMRFVIDLVPADAAALIYDQLTQLTQTAERRKGIGLFAAMTVSIYGASRASGAMIAALNIIYEEKDRRSYLRSAFLSAALTAGAILVMVTGLTAASLLNFAENWIVGVGPIAALAVKIFSWLIAASVCIATIGGIYRFAPNRADASWRWLTLGSVLATLVWVVLTIAFGIYASRFSDYNAAYGSLGAVVVLMMWLYLSAYAVLLGALINTETERQTAQDTTTGRERPIGKRGAIMADTSAALDTSSVSQGHGLSGLPSGAGGDGEGG